MNTLLKNNYSRISILYAILTVAGAQNIFANHNNDDYDESPTTLIFESAQKIGYIGVDADHQTDRREDNIFIIDIDQDISGGHQVWLEFEIEGVADASSVTMVINDRTSVGGYVVNKSNGWHSQKEYIRSDWLQKGKNYIQFGHRQSNGFRYGVKDVRIVANTTMDLADTDIIQWNEVTSSQIKLKNGDIEDRAYIRGIIKPLATSPKSIFIAGQKIEIIDGGFEAIIKRPEFILKNEFWSEKAVIKMQDGTAVTQNLDLERSDSESIWQSTQIDQVKTKTIGFDKNQLTIEEWNNATIKVDAGILKQDMMISMTSLRHSDLVPLDQDLKNVTHGMAGMRYLPHGGHFADTGAVIMMPYDKTKIPAGSSEEDIFTFYYDRSNGKWTGLQRDSIDRVKGHIYSRVTHFTDFINGVISAPETPTSTAYVPTEFQDIGVVSPSAGVQLISPPGASQHGDANLQYPIVVPPGRRGIQPNLAVTYNSASTGGMMGEGWSLSTPSITIETRWGAPRYDLDKESEAYLLNGQQLVMMTPTGEYLPHRRNHATDWENRGTDVEFKVRAQGPGNFERILRKGSGPTNYYWEVTDRNGIKYYYGGVSGVDNNYVLKTHTGDNVSKWCLERVEDLYGNYMTYKYKKFTQLLGNNVVATSIYPLRIDYTGHPSIPYSQTNQYNVIFGYPSTAKSDMTINARTGTIVVDKKLLKSIIVKYKAARVRQYDFDYIEGPFKKSLLNWIRQRDAGGKILMQQDMEYHNEIQSAEYENGSTWILSDNADGDVPSLLGQLSDLPLIPVVGDSDVGYSPINSSSSSSKGFSIYVGVGPAGEITKSNTVGVNYSFASSTSQGEVSLIDINGDGLVDKVYKADNGNNHDLVYKLNTSRKADGTFNFGSEFDISNQKIISNSTNISFSRKVDKNHQFGVQAFFGVQAGLGFNRVGTKIESYFTDVNGDGFVDIIHGGNVNFVVNNNGQLSLDHDSDKTPCPLFSPDESQLLTSLGTAFVPDAAAQAEAYDINPRLDVVRVWEAPSAGDITINFGSANYASMIGDGAVLMVQHNDALIPMNGSQTTQIDVNGSIALGSSTFMVDEGDRIYFRAQSGPDNTANGENDYVDWNPVITYNNGSNLLDPVNLPYNTYDFTQDVLHSQIGAVDITTDGSLSVSGSFTIAGHINDIVDFIVRDLSDGSIVGVQNNITNGTQLSINEPIIVPTEVLYSDNGTPDDTSDDILPEFPITRLSFELRSNSNIDWQKITTENLILNHPSLNNTLTGGQIPVEYKFYREVPGNDFTIFPASNIISMDVDVVPLLAPFIPEEAEYYASIKNETTIFHQVKYTWDGSGFDKTVLIGPNPASGNLNYTITSEVEGFFTSLVDIDEVKLNGVDFDNYSTWIYDPQNRTLFNNFYRNWGHFVYNPDGEFGSFTDPNIMIDQSVLNLDEDDFPDPNNFPDDPNAFDPSTAPYNQPYFQMMCKWHEEEDDAGVDISRFLWTMGDESTLADESGLQPSRLGDDNPVLDLLSNLGGGWGYPALIKESRSESFAVTAGAGPLSVNVLSNGSMDMVLDYRDMNGDRIPDVVSPSHIIYSYADGDLALAERYSAGAFHSENRVLAGLGIGGGTNFSTSKKDANEGIEDAKSVGQISFSANANVNEDESNSYWADINGDGLADKILVDAVELNTGYGFVNISKYHTSPLSSYPDHSLSTSLSTGLSVGNSFAWGSFNVGLGVSKTNADNDMSFIDINGDGMVDYISDGNVYINTGIAFSHDPNFDIPRTDLITRTKTIGYNGNAAFTVGFSTPIFKVVVNPGVFFSKGMSRTEATFMDVDGDGFVDFLEKGSDDDGVPFNGDADLVVHRSKIGKTNKLKFVRNKYGGAYEIDYGLTAATVDHPGGKWAMKELIITDDTHSNVATINTEFDYSGGKYERCERQFLGFNEVTVSEITGNRKNISTYHNQDVYRSGKLVQSEIIKPDPTPSDPATSDEKWLEAQANYEVRSSVDLDDALDPMQMIDMPTEEVIFVAPSSSKTLLWYKSGGGYIGESSTMSYDAHGNMELLKYANNGNDVTSPALQAEEYTVNIGYFKNPTYNILGIANSHTVTDPGIGALRQSSATINNNPAITAVGAVMHHAVSVSDGIVETDYTYDVYGNVETMIAPDNGSAVGQRCHYKYGYDQKVQQYVEQIDDLTLGFTTLLGDYNFKFGLVGSKTSINNQITTYKYDNVGRLTNILGPKELKVNYVYTYDGTLKVYNKATTKRTVPSLNSSTNIIESYVFVDGFGRSLGAGTQSIINGDPIRQIIWSGVPTYDGLGRVISTSRPISGSDTAPAINGNPLSSTTYDILDRPLTQTNLAQTYTYDYDFDFSPRGPLKTTIQAPNFNVTENLSEYKGAVWQSTRKGSGGDPDIRTLFDYDALDQVRLVTAPNGIKTIYGYGPDGKVTGSRGPNGTFSYGYSPLGLKTSQSESSGWSADYKYDYYRLIKIDYGGDHTKFNVEYTYGDQMSTVEQNSKDRVVEQKDISGIQRFKYDELGAVKTQIRDYAIPLVTDRAHFVTEWKYDAWNRVEHIIYPDKEVVKYSYDDGGNLYSVAGVKSSNNYPYINAIKYDEYGQRISVLSGNNILETYTYNNKRFLKNSMSSINQCDYVYDGIGNVVSKANSTSPRGSGDMTYNYDSFDRLKDSQGSWSASNGGAYSYDNVYTYDGAGNFKKKNSILTRTDLSHYPTGLSKVSKKDYTYVPNTNQMWYVTEDYMERIGQDPQATGLNRITSHQYRGSPTGGSAMEENVNGVYREAEENNYANLTVDPESDTSRSQTNMVYQVEDRLGAISIDNNVSHYFYDGAGERFLKLKETFQDIYVNGELSGNEIEPIDYTFYVSPLLVIRPGRSYTKHIYVGSERIVSKIGEPDDYLDPTDGALSLSGNKGIMEVIIQDNYNDLLSSDVSIADFTRIPYVQPFTFGMLDNNGGPEDDRYFFSKDQIGSSHFITNAAGEIINHVEYMPFGESFVDWTSIDWKTPYRFTGQEQDCETGLYYYGARYYDPAVGRFLTTDPLMDRLPGQSPYAYVLNNPVRYNDPTGMYEDESAATSAQQMAIAQGHDVGDIYQSGDEWGFNIANGDESSSVFNRNFSNGVESSLASGEIRMDDNLLGAGISGSLFSGSAYNESGGAAISIGTEMSSISGQADLRIGSQFLGLHGSGEGSLSSAEANLDIGWFTGQKGRRGPYLDANIGAYSAEGALSGGGYIFGIKYTYSVGASIMSAHAGLTGGASYNSKTRIFTIEGMEHIGFGVGEKAGLKIEIPIPRLKN